MAEVGAGTGAARPPLRADGRGGRSSGSSPSAPGYSPPATGAPELKRQRIGTRLLTLTAQAVLDCSPASGLYLRVLEQNTDARAFCTARGAACAERPHLPPPGEDPARLNGKPITLAYAWRDPSRLLTSHPSAPRDRPSPTTGTGSPDSRYQREARHVTGERAQEATLAAHDVAVMG
jgi:hypothetical protein